MKILLGILLSFGLVFAALPADAAPNNEAPTLAGIGDAVTWTDESGATIASATIFRVEEDFRGYDPGWEPQFGYQYVLVEASVVNESDQSIIVEPYPFQLVDDYGDRHNYLNLGSDEVETFYNDLALASGESAEITLGYQIPSHATPSLLTWNPENERTHYVVLSTDAGENSAIAWGRDTPSVLTDDFTNPVATFTVTGINENWTDYDDRSAPGDGNRFVAVSVKATNQIDRPVEIDPYDFFLANDDGSASRFARARVAEGVDEPFREREMLEAGETMEVTIVFELPTGAEPVAVVWRLTSATVNIVMLAPAPESSREMPATPVSTPS